MIEGVSPLWGEIRSGPYAVGFNTEFRFDAARTYGKTYPDLSEPPAPKRPRPILVHRWYPAESTQDEVMPYREYLNFPSASADLQSFIERLAEHNRDIVSVEVLGKPLKQLDDAEQAAFEDLMKSPTAAVKGAAPAPGRFPLIVYHPGLGGSIEDNAVLFEYLASHGYVVVSSAYPSENAAHHHIDWDLERSFRDMDFLIHVLQDDPQIDLQRVVAMGHSYGAQAALAWRSEPNSLVDAVVSLDSTVEYAPSDFPGFQKLWEKIGRAEWMAVPLLLFAQASGHPQFNHYDCLPYADRYYATVQHLRHNDFLSHGAIGSVLSPKVDSEAPESRLLQESYEQVCRLTRQFLEAVLKDSDEARVFLQEMAQAETSGSSPVALRYQAAVPVPTKESDLIVGFREKGIEPTLDLCRRFRADLSEVQLNLTGMELVRRGQAKEAVALLLLAVEWFPDAIHVHDGLGRAHAALGDRERSEAAYRKELALIPSDDMSEEHRAEKVKDVTDKLNRLRSSDDITKLDL